MTVYPIEDWEVAMNAPQKERFVTATHVYVVEHNTDYANLPAEILAGISCLTQTG